MVKQMLEDRYLAGLREGILPSQLLWQVFDSQKYDGRPSIRPPHYRAPSWSWASLDGFVDWPCITRTGNMITIIEAHVTSVTSDATGQVKDGFIRLRGHLCPAEVYLMKQSSRLNSDFELDHTSSSKRRLVSILILVRMILVEFSIACLFHKTMVSSNPVV